MKLETTAAINAPTDYVFERMTSVDDIAFWLTTHGADIERIKGDDDYIIGTTWQIEGEFRGKYQRAKVILERFDIPSYVRLKSTSKDAEALLELQFTPHETNQTLVTLIINPKAKTISYRLILQAAKLAIKTVQARLDERFDRLCQNIEDDYHRSRIQ